jgi:hypothetical protein
MTFVQIQNLHSPELVLNHPIAPAAEILQRMRPGEAQLLLRHLAFEQIRHDIYIWEEIQLALALVLGALLYQGARKKLFPLTLCGVMFALVLFQHVAATPELAYQGRETDFPPGSLAEGPLGRVWALQQIYAGIEIVKLIAGAVLASYLFAYRSTQRRRSTSETSVSSQMNR